MILGDGTVYPHPGKVLFVNREVDSRTGTIQVRGEFPNPGNVLRPGQYARIRAVTEFRKGALLIPQQAVSELQGVYQVGVVGTDNKVTIHDGQARSPVRRHVGGRVRPSAGGKRDRRRIAACENRHNGRTHTLQRHSGQRRDW